MNRGIIRAVCLSLVALATGYVIAVRATASGRAEKTVVREWGDTAHVEETLTKVIAADGVKKVMVQSDFGSIAALPSTDGKVHLAAVTTISGQKYSEAELKALLKEVEIVVTTEGGTVHIHEKRGKLPQNVGASVEYTVRVPEALSLALHSANGKVAAETGHDVEARSDFGAVRVTSATGTIYASSANGAITVADCPSAIGVTAHSDFGAVTVRSAGTTIKATSANGAIAIESVPQAVSITAHSDFGSVSLTDVGGKIEAKSSNGAVKVERATVSDSLDLHSDFGGVEAGKIRAGGNHLVVRLTSENGSVRYTGPASRLTLTSSFGEVRGEMLAGLTFDGGTVKTQNGSVSLTIPATLAAKVQASTDNGKITVNGLPGSVSSGDGLGKGYIETLNAGTAPLELASAFGSVTLSAGR